MFRFPQAASGNRWRSALHAGLAVSGLVAALAAAPVRADDAADVSKLLRAGQFTEAMSRTDAYLARQPRDAQMRFLKGVILTEQNKPAEAIAVFTKLTEDFPELPEPYNNLAVLHAAAGQYDKARNALEMAIRTNPSYATAYENLGDMHAKLASQAYDKALQLDSGNANAKSKLTLLRSLSGSAKALPPVAVAKAPAPVVVAQAPKTAPTAPVAQKPAAAPAPAPAPAPVPVPAAQAPVAKAEAVKPEPVKPEPKPTPKPAPQDDQRDDVLKVVHGWAKAWSARDVKGYLNFYANDFQTPGGVPRKAWATERESRIAGKGRISVTIEAPQVAVDGNTATVRFRQNYVSDRLNAESRKTLVLARQGGKWLIKQERTGS
jgi:tetratricopeptide (TPR) repeat protein